jgi:hypothetical protein
MSEPHKLDVHLRMTPEVWWAYRDQCYRHGLRLRTTVEELLAQWTAERRREAVPHYLRKGDRDATK